MKLDTVFLVIVLTFVFGMLIGYWVNDVAVEYQVYDCSISDIDPDYPPEVKEQCRRIRSERNFI